MRSRSLALAASILLGCAVAPAAGPGVLNFEGYLADESGAPVNGTHDVRLTLYGGNPTPGPATLLEEQAFPAISISDGRLRLAFGGGGSFADRFADHPDLHVLLEVDLDNSGTFEPDEAYSPATRLTNAPYAFAASWADGATTASAVDWDDVLDRPEGLDDGDDDLLAELEGESVQTGDIVYYTAGEFRRRLLYGVDGIVFPDGEEQARAALDPGETGREGNGVPCTLSFRFDGTLFSPVELASDFVVSRTFSTGLGQQTDGFGPVVVRRGLGTSTAWRDLWEQTIDGFVGRVPVSLTYNCSAGNAGTVEWAFTEMQIVDYEIVRDDSGRFYEQLELGKGMASTTNVIRTGTEPAVGSFLDPPTLGLREGLSSLTSQANTARLRMPIGLGLATLLTGVEMNGPLAGTEFSIRTTSLTPGLEQDLETLLVSVWDYPALPLRDLEVDFFNRDTLLQTALLEECILVRARLYVGDDGQPLLDLRYETETLKLSFSP